MRKLTIAESRARRAAEYQRHTLAQSYADIAAHIRAELPLHIEPDPPAPRMTAIVAGLERQGGHPAPAGTLTAWQILQLAERRQR